MTTRSDAALGLLIGGALLACGGPTDRYRQTALVPAAQLPAWDGTAVGEGRARLEGSAALTSLERTELRRETDSAVWVPSLTLDGAALIGAARQVEFGLRGSYADHGWARESAPGTPPLPEPLPSWSIGPEVRLALVPEGRVRVGFVASLARTSVPTAAWSQSCAGTVCTGPLTLVRRRTATALGYAVSFNGAVDVSGDARAGSVLFAAGADTSYESDAFANSTADPLSTAVVLLVGAGYGVRLDALSLALLGVLPIEAGEVGHGPGGVLSVGYTPTVWEAAP